MSTVDLEGTFLIRKQTQAILYAVLGSSGSISVHFIPVLQLCKLLTMDPKARITAEQVCTNTK